MTLISDSYRAQLAQLHTERPDFGTSSVMYAPIVKSIISRYKPSRLLDVGCGKQALKTALGLNDRLYVGYDPAIPECSNTPNPEDLVVCTDVMEHVEPEFIESVFDDLQRVTRKVGFFAIHTGKAIAILPDGRNAHLIQESPDWWLPKILSRFSLVAFEKGDNGFWVLVEPKGYLNGK